MTVISGRRVNREKEDDFEFVLLSRQLAVCEESRRMIS